MIILIAEKPSLAKAIKASIEKNTNEQFKNVKGFYKGQNHCITWCYGHLFELCNIDDYLGEKRSWSEVDLPYIPKTFKYKVKEDCEEQVEVIRYLVNLQSTTEIIHACDSDNEGEVIGRLAIQNTVKDVSKVIISRLWATDTTETTIWNAYKNRKPDSAYDKEFNAGQCRAFVDWIIGINATRAITVKSGTLFNLGRVIVPIVQKIVEREEERAKFKESRYYGLSCGYCESRTTFDDQQDAETGKKRLNECGYAVEDIKTTKKTIKRPRLFSQTTLQNELSHKNYKPDQVLNLTQKLYEKGLTTYPRTDSEFLTSEEIGKVKRSLAVYGDQYTCTGKEPCFNDKLVVSHSAIIPTGKKASGLSKDENVVYSAIVARFLLNFFKEECKVEETKIALTVNGEHLETTFVEVLQKGWNEDIESKPLPEGIFTKGIHKKGLEWTVVEKQTRKPQNMTISTLNNYCEHPFSTSCMDENYDAEVLKGLTLGTPATRAGIIKKAIDTGYLALSGQTYRSTEKGREMVKVLKENKIPINAEMSVKLQTSIHSLKMDEVMKNTCISIVDIVDKIKKSEVKQMENTNAEGKKYICAWCGEELVKIKSKDGKTYFTHKSKKNEETGEYEKTTNCNFFTGTTFKYFGVPLKLTDAQMEKLMTKGSVKIKKFETKWGAISGDLYIKDEPNIWNGKEYVQIDFKNKKIEK